MQSNVMAVWNAEEPLAMRRATLLVSVVVGVLLCSQHLPGQMQGYFSEARPDLSPQDDTICP